VGRRGGRAGGARERRRLGAGQVRGQGPGAGAVRARARPGRLPRPRPHHPPLLPHARLRAPGRPGLPSMGGAGVGGGGAAGGDHRRPRPVPGRLRHPPWPVPVQPGDLRRPLPVAGRGRGDAPLACLPPGRRRPRPVAARRRHGPGHPRHPGRAAPGRLRSHPGQPGPGHGRPRPRRLGRGGHPEASFRAGRLLLCTDAWTGDLLAQLGAALPLVVTQEQFSYFRPADPAAFAVGRFPVWIWMDDPSFYGFPVWPDTALKAAQDVGGPRVTATTRGFDPDPAASERLAGFLRARLPAAVGAHDHTATCLYTLTPDRDLVLGPSPAMTASWSPSAPPTASSSPPCSAGSWPTWPCTAAPTSTSPRSPPTARPSPPPSRRPGTWSEALDAAVTVVGTMPERSGPHLACECRHKGGHEEPAHRHPDRGRARLSAGRTRCPRGPA
jgi:hypothetical protein